MTTEAEILREALQHAQRVLAILVSPGPAPSSLYLWAQCVEAEQKARKALTMDLPPTSHAAQEMLKGRGD